MEDNLQMHLHHFSTITLLLISYLLNLHRAGERAGAGGAGAGARGLGRGLGCRVRCGAVGCDRVGCGGLGCLG